MPDRINEAIEQHRAACTRELEHLFGNLAASLNSLHAKTDSVINRLTVIEIAHGKTEQRLIEGTKHFDRLDAEVNELRKNHARLWITMGKIALWIAAGAGGGVGFVKLFGG